MIPEGPNYTEQNNGIEGYELLPAKTYKIDWTNKRIMGNVDAREAVMQFIRKVLSTDKYAYEIYDWYYGNELRELVGKSYDYAVTRVPNIIKEALLVDDRITDVRDFTFVKSAVDAITVSCYVDTVYGSIKYDLEVMI